MKKRLLITISLLVILLMCLTNGCHHADVPVSNQIDWKMNAYCIGENTGLQFQTTLSIVGEKPSLDGIYPREFTVQMELEKNHRWILPNFTTPLIVTIIGKAQGAPSTFLLSHISIYDATTNFFMPGWFALDIENEMALFSIEREEQIYIAASTDETIQPEDIITHFQAALDFMNK